MNKLPGAPGKYDDECTHVREQTQAEGVVVMVVGGDRGDGFSVQGNLQFVSSLPFLLRNIATNIELQRKMGTPPRG